MSEVDRPSRRGPRVRGHEAEQLELIAGCGQIAPFPPASGSSARASRRTPSICSAMAAWHSRCTYPGAARSRSPPWTTASSSAGRGSSPYRWHLDGRRGAGSALISFDGACLRGKGDSDHELGYGLMMRFAEQMVERLQATRLQILDVYGHVPAG